jgi:hypothetical protein
MSIASALRLAALTAIFQLVAAPASAAVKQTPIRHVFVIAFENHNWTQPKSDDAAPQQIFGNPAAPYINSLVTPGNPNAAHVSYASAYHNVLATPSGKNPHIHPSEPNYVWAEAGSNLGVTSDSDPFGWDHTNQATRATLSTYLTRAGKSWRSYQEDIDIDHQTGRVLPRAQWTVPLTTETGTFRRGRNPYNGSAQYGYAPKHNPPVLFTVSNGGNDTSPANPKARYYAPLRRLKADLASGHVANYNWISPNLYNDMHTGLTGGFTYHGKHYVNDVAAIAQGDNFAARIVPLIMASKAYKEGGVIILWWDETEGRGQDDFRHTIAEIIISPYAKGNAYTNHIAYTHSSDLKTIQAIFGAGPCLRHACAAHDLSDLFVPGTIPKRIH